MNQVSDEWRSLLCSLPGYDPFAQAGECWFDPDAATRAITFIELLKHIEGKMAGKPFLLERWQKAIVANLFGWKRPDGTRRFREVFIYVARKNGKTPLIAAICLYVLFCDGEAGAQMYGAASSKEQAGYLFRHAKGMTQRNPFLNKKARVYDAHKSIQLYADPASTYRVLAADGDTSHGGNSHFVVIDEVHALPNRELVDTLRSSFASSNRIQPMMIYITTADWNRESICNEKYDQACKVRDNKGDPAQVGYNPDFLPAIYELAKEDDWKDEANWHKANPNLDVSVDREFLRGEVKTAKENPANENRVRRLHFNQRTESDVRAIDAEQWRVCGHGNEPISWRERMLEEMLGTPCAAGLDLGATNDLTALVFVFDQLRPRIVLPFFWATEAAVERRRRNRVPYDVWVSQGFIRTTPGNVTDYDVVRADIIDLVSKYPIREAWSLGPQFVGRMMLAVDRLFQGVQLCTQLEENGIPPIAFGQGFMSMAMPTKRTLELIGAHELDHGNNPVLAWMAGNASTKEDDAGNLKFSKKHSGDKIDGIVGLTMAVGLAEATPVDEPAGIFV